jgi:hypothetical protein
MVSRDTAADKAALPAISRGRFGCSNALERKTGKWGREQYFDHELTASRVEERLEASMMRTSESVKCVRSWGPDGGA